jgi:hypothetical protein
LAPLLGNGGGACLHHLTAFGFLLGLFLGGRLAIVLLVRFDDVDAHVGEHRHDVFDLLGGDLLEGSTAFSASTVT